MHTAKVAKDNKNCKNIVRFLISTGKLALWNFEGNFSLYKKFLYLGNQGSAMMLAWQETTKVAKWHNRCIYIQVSAFIKLHILRNQELIFAKQSNQGTSKNDGSIS